MFSRKPRWPVWWTNSTSQENVIMGRVIPAGTGMPVYRDTFVKGDFTRCSMKTKKQKRLALVLHASRRQVGLPPAFFFS